MTAIFYDICEKIVEVFMDDFSVYGKSFDEAILIEFCRDASKQILS